MDQLLISKLNQLLKLLHQSRHNLEEYADLIRDSQLQCLFNELADQRYSIIASLTGAIRFLGSTPYEYRHPSFLGDLIRAIKTLLTPNDIVSITNQLRMQETEILDCYYDVMKHEIPKPVKALLKQQLHVIESSMYRIELSSYAW